MTYLEGDETPIIVSQNNLEIKFLTTDYGFNAQVRNSSCMVYKEKQLKLVCYSYARTLKKISSKLLLVQ